ncbi:hypothetical protein AAG570_001446 [Ranatra chinensis]|uniref:Uncharacterized protein n=1 Tax=Ranatra chinensis TaxID=642074 RepID=A0ABD0YR73_9HEMI
MDHDNDTLGYLTEIEQELSEITKTMDFRTVAPDNLAALEIKCEEISALLIYSTANGLLNLYQLLLKFVGLEMIRDSMGWTPLMQSIRHGHLDVAQCIMEDGGCIRSFNYHGADVMSVAVASGDLNIVKFFLEKINSTQSDNLLGCMSYIATACAYGFADIAKFLLQTHPNEIDDAVEKSEMTPLMLAVAGGHISVVRLLTTCGAELTPKNSMGLSARDIALLANDEKVLSALGVSLPRTPIYSENHFLFPPQQSPLLLKLPVVFHQRKMNSNSNRMPYPMVHNKNQCFSCSSNLATTDDGNKTKLVLINQLGTGDLPVKPTNSRLYAVICTRCQEYQHTKGYCNRPPRYDRCGGGHESSTCLKTRETPATCALCGGGHPANYKGCQVYKDLQERSRPGQPRRDVSSGRALPVAAVPTPMHVVDAPSKVHQPPQSASPATRSLGPRLLHPPKSTPKSAIYNKKSHTSQISTFNSEGRTPLQTPIHTERSSLPSTFPAMPARTSRPQRGNPIPQPPTETPYTNPFHPEFLIKFVTEFKSLANGLISALTSL